MKITNGFVTREITPDKLPEYKAKGYAAVEEPAAKPKRGKKAGALNVQ